jgi:hypothetical protein
VELQIPRLSLPMYKRLNQIESTADLGRVLFIDFMTSPQARSSARDDKERVDIHMESGCRTKGVFHHLRWAPRPTTPFEMTELLATTQPFAGCSAACTSHRLHPLVDADSEYGG